MTSPHTHPAERETPAGEAMREALTKINAIRNSIIGLQTMNWSEHIYPLVAALEAAGFEGMDYPEARENFGTMLERTNAAEAALTTLRADHAAEVARARREALEEAAKVASADAGELRCANSVATAERIMFAIRDRALAATPPEARQTETGWKPMDTAHKDGRTILACRDNGCGWDFHLVRWQSGKHGYPWQSATDGNAFPEGRLDYWLPLPAPPPPAIGNLEGEGRS